MVTSNELPDKKVVKMSEQNMGVVVPQRTLLGEVNEHIMCPLCRGYYIDATTIVECLHSFCRSCIIKHLQVKSYCPVCEMMINSAKPNIKLDKALQDIVYKLVPGLFQKEMERRQQFYASRPGPAASATPEQRGEDTERVIFSPEDVISFSLEYADATDTDSISSKSSAELDSNEPQPPSAIARRYLQCPAVVNISHLKKFLSMKFDIDSTQFAIDILYKRVPLPDYYTLMDIAYIYNWKRNEPMRFFYQIIDYVAIRNRLFDINRIGPKYRERKSSPASTEETNASSPAANLNDNGSESSSGTDSPMPNENVKQTNETCQKRNNSEEVVGANTNSDNSNNSEDVEKSQFLNSFELTAKSNSVPTVKISPIKSNTTEITPPDLEAKSQPSLKVEDNLKRKHPTTANVPEIKKLKIELEKTKIPGHPSTSLMPPKEKPEEHVKIKEAENIATVKQQCPESPAAKQPPTLPQQIPSKRKVSSESTNLQPTPTLPKTVSPLKLQLPKLEPPSPMLKQPDMQKSVPKKIPDLKPSVPNSPQSNQNKSQLSTKVRMDLLANNSDPTIDRSKIMSQVKSSLNLQSMGQASGDLKSLFNSCKINIPSSLSITLTDQKDQRNPNDTPNADNKNNVINKNLAGSSNVVPHGIPTTPVHNYIEILKLPDSEPKKQIKSDNNSDSKSTPTAKAAETGGMQQKPPGKSSETSAKGPVPNLKPIDPKAGKQNVNFTAPITFQQSFEQQVHSLQTDKKPKPKNKSQVPKLVPANPKTFSAVNKLSGGNTKPTQSGLASNTDNKPSTALDLSTPHNIQSHLSPHQTKTLETMQSIANLANKQNLPSKNTSLAMPPKFNTIPNRPIATGSLRIASTSLVSPHKHEKLNTSATHSSLRPDAPKNQSNKPVSNPIPITSSPNYQLSLQPSTPTHPSPRSQTRSPSSSPKLVIAEEKQIPNTSNIPESNLNQSNQISSSHSVTNPKNESTKVMPGPSKPGLKPIKPVPSANKISGVRQPLMTSSSVKSNPAQSHLNLLSHELLRQSMGQMDMSAWLHSAHSTFSMYKNMTNRPQHYQNDFNKDKP